MKVVVGSQNPVKLEAVELGIKELWPSKQIELLGMEVDSGINEQPLSDVEMIKGAKKRAHAAITGQKDARYGVGLEGGLHEIDGEWFGRSWIAVEDQNGNVGIGSSISVQIPAQMMQLIHQGKNMSEVCEILYGVKDIGKKEGYIGLLTGYTMSRASAYKDGVIMAFSRFNTIKVASRG